MYDVQDEPVERLYLYVVRDDERPSMVFLPFILSILSLLLVIAVGVLYPYHPLLVRQTITVPAIFLPPQTFSTTEQVIPTGIRIVSATHATGMLTLTNGSILAQHLPAGMIFTTSNNIEVITTESVDVPASNGVRFGVASVSAQAVSSGAVGNLAPLAIDAVYGTSLYIRNNQAFSGGNNSYSTPVLQPKDTQDALAKARLSLSQHTLTGLLDEPCTERVTGSATLTVTWTCRFVTYQITGQVITARVQGHSIVIEVLVVASKQIRETK